MLDQRDARSYRHRVAVSTAGVLVLLAAACSSDSRECTVNADCASGTCLSDGRCAALSSGTPEEGGEDGTVGFPDVVTDAGDESGGDTADPTGDSTATEGDADGEDNPDANPGVCSPNQDGIIEQSELPFAVGLQTKYSTAVDATVNTAGTVLDDGTRAWDFTDVGTAGALEIVEARSVGEQWFGPSYPQGDYAAKLSFTEDLLGIFIIDEGSIDLIGIASEEDGLLKTELDYDPSVSALRFPLEVGESWEIETTVTGTLNGVPTAPYLETYTYTVDARGEVTVPFGTFDALRIAIELDQKNLVGISFNQSRQFVFVSECFGTVASMRSESFEDAIEFTSATEVRRLSP